jgi:FtsZ-binding cell division protein ZapB
MSKAPVFQAGRVTFELDRFELVDGDRCQLQGRWFGVRGRRFMRPALTVVVDGQPTRLLADLADKPWAAEDGRPWHAAFPCPIAGDQLLEAELTVAPDVTITLPAPQGRMVAGKKKPGAGANPPRMRGKRGADRGPDDDGREAPERRGRPQRRSPASDSGAAPGGELAALTRDLADARNEQRRLHRQLDRVEAEKARAAARVDELIGDLSQVTREREEAHAARDRMAAEHETLQVEFAQISDERDAVRREHERIAAERDAARRAGDEALQASQAASVAREQALAERGAAMAAQKRAVSDCTAAMAERDQAVSGREAALAVQAQALAERDAAVAAREEAISERDALSRSNDRLQSELADRISARGAALVMRRAAQGRTVSRPQAPLLPLGIVIVVLLAVALVIVLRVL